MRTKLKLVLMSFGVTMLVTVGLSVMTFYTYHQGASLHKVSATGPAASTLSPLATQNPAIAETTTFAQSQAEPASATPVTQPSKASGQHDNGHSPFDDPTKVITNVGPNNPALLKSLPAFLR